MKKIGMISGTSWPSTIPYYEWLNQKANEIYGGYHSARIMLHNVDYHRIKSQYNEANGWSIIPKYLLEEINDLMKSEPDCIMICNNTLHKAIDILASQGNLPKNTPVIHIVDAVGEMAVKNSYQRLLLLGTKFTMEDGFYADKLKDKYDLCIEIPNENHRNMIQEMQSEIALGNMKDEYRIEFKNILTDYKNFDAIILGCTELPLAIDATTTPIPIINVIEQQCIKVANFAFK